MFEPKEPLDSNRPVFARATSVVTLCCNLKCKLCVIGIPYYKKPWHPTLEFINRVTDRLFEIADYEIFEFTGGEPLIRTDFADVLAHALQYESHVSTRFGFQTNGAIPITDRVVDAAKHFGEKVKVIVDDYGPELSPYAEQNYEILQQKGIPSELRQQNEQAQYCDGWVDYLGDGCIGHSDEKARMIFQKCAQPQIMHFCATVTEGMVFPCPVIYTLKARFGEQPAENEYIDLFSKEETVETIREKWKGFYSLKLLNACKRCDGICADSPRFVPAEQAENEDGGKNE